MRRPNEEMLLRIAQADAYGMAREFVKQREHPEHVKAVLLVEGYLPNPNYPEIRPGRYTDDTQMSIAVAEALLEDPSPSAERFLRGFYETFKRDQRLGYSRKFQPLLEQAESPAHLGQLISAKSVANGGAMRAVPIGVLSTPAEVIEVASRQAEVTHTESGVVAAVSVALMSHFALYVDAGFDEMHAWCCEHLPAQALFAEPWTGPVQENAGLHHGLGLNTAWAVETLLRHETSLMGILSRALRWGGDTDSVCAIAWGIASARHRDDVPAFLERDLEVGGAYGPVFLRELGRKLMRRYDARAPMG